MPSGPIAATRLAPTCPVPTTGPFAVALALLAPLASPAFTGTPTTPTLNSAAANTPLTLQSRNFTTAADGIDAITGTWTHSSGTGIGVNVKPTFSTTGTAGWTAFQVNATQTSDTGTGTKLLANLAMGGVSKLSVDYLGTTNIAGNTTVNGNFISSSVFANGGGSTLNLYGGYATIGTAVSVQPGSTLTATSGTQVAVRIAPTYNQNSGTAANTDLLINRTETALGSGTQRFVSFQTAATGEKLGLNNAGRWVYAAADAAPANTTTPAAWITTYVGTTAYKTPLYQ